MKKTKVGQELIEGMEAVLAHAKGEERFRETTVEIPPPAPRWTKNRVLWLRKQCFRVSQPRFAAILSVKPATVRSWEQGLKTPSGAASRLLQLAELEPSLFTRLAVEAKAGRQAHP